MVPKVVTSDGVVMIQGAEVTLSSPCGSISATVLAGLPTAIDQVRTSTIIAFDDLSSDVNTSISRAVEQAADRTDYAESRSNAAIVEVQSRSNAAIVEVQSLITASTSRLTLELAQQAAIISSLQASLTSRTASVAAAASGATAAVTGLLIAANQTVFRELTAIRSDLAIGLTAANPINTCMAVKNKGQSGFYWVRPAGTSAPVKVWCDERWGGGWLQVFRKHPVVPPLCWTRAT